MPSSCEIFGTVLNKNNNAIKDAKIMIVDAPEKHLDIALLTDRDGFFMLYNLVPGQYMIKVNADKFRPKTIGLNVTSESEKIEIILENI